MRQQIKGEKGLIACHTCGIDRFQLPDDEAFDPVIKCICGNVLGPVRSLRALADGEAHTGINADLKS
jgi:hypothetical protein